MSENGKAGLWPTFLAGILDLRFQRNLTMQLLPLFYVLLLLGALGAVALINALAFWLSLWAGLLVLLVSPLALLVAAAVIRATLEYLVMAYRIMETVQHMDRIPGQVDNLNARVDHITTEFAHISRTLHDLRPVLLPLSLPGRLARRLNRPAPAHD